MQRNFVTKSLDPQHKKKVRKLTLKKFHMGDNWGELPVNNRNHNLRVIPIREMYFPICVPMV